MTERDYNELDCVCALDLETSGLDERNDQILEVAALFGKVEDGKFVELGRFDRVLPLCTDIETWNEKVVEMHTKNGLLAEAIKVKKARVMRSTCAFEECDRVLVRVAPSLPTYKARWTLLGNSVHFDLRFVRRVFPEFAALLSHRVIDVSSTRLFVQGLGMTTEPAEVPHRAMPDVLSSIAQYERQGAWVRDHFKHAGALESAMGSSWECGELGSTAVGHGAG